MSKPRTVSVVIPCWRAASTVRRAIASVAAQRYPALEVLTIDDASGDETFDTLEQIAAEYSPGWVRPIRRSVNGGPGPARNDGWEAARGDYIAFLDADDAWHPDKVARQIAWMTDHPDVALTGHRSILAMDSKPVWPVEPSFDATRVTLNRMLLSNAFLTRTVMLKRALPFRFRGRSVSEDFLLWAEIVASGAPCYRLETVLACSYRPEFDPGGYNGDLWAAERRELAALGHLRETGKLSGTTWGAAALWSLAKYLRRGGIVRLRRLRAQGRSSAISGS